MGIFDRIASAFERNNPDAVYTAELEKLDARIREVKRNLRAEGSRELLEGLLAKRAQLDEERVRAPAQKALAESRIATAEANSSLGSTDEAEGLNSIRERVDQLNRRATPGELDADGLPIAARRAALDRQAVEADARAQLEAMKRALKGEDDS